MHSLLTQADCDEAEERVKAALRDAIRAHQGELQNLYRGQLIEIEQARVAIIPKPREA